MLWLRVFTRMRETDESNYSGRQTALLKQELRDAQSSHVLINIIHLIFKGKCMASRLDGALEDGDGCEDEDVWLTTC